MSKLLGACLLCNKSENLNTTEVKFEDKVYAASLCTTCEEDASPKIMRKALAEKFEKLKQLIETAKSLGVELTMESLVSSGSKLTVATPVGASAPAPAVQAPPAQMQSAPVFKTDKVIRLQDDKGNRVAPETYQVELKEAQVLVYDGSVAGRIPIPKTIVSNSGVLHVDVKKMTSRDFDNRFRAQAARSLNSSNGIEGVRDNPCQACNSAGWTGRPPVLCKECDGTGTRL